MGNITISQEEIRDLKLMILFNFYMWIMTSKENPSIHCPFEFVEVEVENFDFCKILEIEKLINCSRNPFSTTTTTIEKFTICSEFKFISGKNKKECPCEQYGEEAMERLKKLLIYEGFIPKEMK